MNEAIFQSDQTQQHASWEDSPLDVNYLSTILAEIIKQETMITFKSVLSAVNNLGTAEKIDRHLVSQTILALRGLDIVFRFEHRNANWKRDTKRRLKIRRGVYMATAVHPYTYLRIIQNRDIIRAKNPEKFMEMRKTWLNAVMKNVSILDLMSRDLLLLTTSEILASIYPEKSFIDKTKLHRILKGFPKGMSLLDLEKLIARSEKLYRKKRETLLKLINDIDQLILMMYLCLNLISMFDDQKREGDSRVKRLSKEISSHDLISRHFDIINHSLKKYVFPYLESKISTHP